MLPGRKALHIYVLPVEISSTRLESRGGIALENLAAITKSPCLQDLLSQSNLQQDCWLSQINPNMGCFISTVCIRI
jgi:hypothetical protein